MEYTITFPVPLNKPMRRKYHFNYGPFNIIFTGTVKPTHASIISNDKGE